MSNLYKSCMFTSLCNQYLSVIKFLMSYVLFIMSSFGSPPGHCCTVAKQFLRCTLHQLAPNGIFPQLFLSRVEGKSSLSVYRLVLCLYPLIMSKLTPAFLRWRSIPKNLIVHLCFKFVSRWWVLEDHGRGSYWFQWADTYWCHQLLAWGMIP